MPGQLRDPCPIVVALYKGWGKMLATLRKFNYGIGGRLRGPPLACPSPGPYSALPTFSGIIWC